LKRAEIKPEIKDVDYTSEEIASKAVEFIDDNEDCLVICNTIRSAKGIFKIIKDKVNYKVYHFSARMTLIRRKIAIIPSQIIEAGG
jgi:CRISPR-associated endonuclease/helicase Cas3